MAIKETYNGVETNVIVYGSSFLVSDDLITSESIGNLDLIINSINYVTKREASVNIMPKSLKVERLLLRSSDVNLWGAVTVLVLTIFILIIGGVTVIRRRKKVVARVKRIKSRP